MTNPYKAFRQWRKERYYANLIQWVRPHHHDLAFDNKGNLMISEGDFEQWVESANAWAIACTRSDFNDPTFEPRSKSK